MEGQGARQCASSYKHFRTRPVKARSSERRRNRMIEVVQATRGGFTSANVFKAEEVEARGVVSSSAEKGNKNITLTMAIISVVMVS